jgi:2'-5' RNA ligase
VAEGQRLRLFVAATIPRDVLDAAAAVAEELRPLFPGARWTDVANQHVTLKFLGWADAGLLREVCAACARVAARHAPAPLKLGDPGAFPSKRRVRVVWVGLDDPAGLLAAAARDLDGALEPLGFESEARAFTAHLTLARLRTPVRVAGEWPRVVLPERSWTCDALTLFRSHLSPKGARYEALAAFPLGRLDGTVGKQ